MLSTPRKLSNLAARVFVEDLVLESQLFFNFTCIKDNWSSMDMKSLNYKFCFAWEINEVKENIVIIMTYMDEILGSCSVKTIESILMVLRTTDHYCSLGAIVLQFLYDTEVNLRRKHSILFPILASVHIYYKTVQKFIFDSLGEQNSVSYLGQLIHYLPNLKIFKGVVTKGGKFINSLQSNCPKLTDLTLCVIDGVFTSNQLALFFFSGKSLDYIKKAFVKLETVPLTFPNLQKFSISGVGYELYDFFKMFLHFYTKVNFVVGLHYSPLYFNSVSWFDSVLSHSVIINPDLCVSECELNIHDFFLPFCEKSLHTWKNLSCLLISLGIQGKKNPTTLSNIGRRLESLLAKQERAKELCIKIQGPVSEDELAEILHPSLKAHGRRFRRLKVLGLVHFLSHRSLVDVLNLCPNVRHLVLIGKRIMKYFKDVKLKENTKLESLTVIWSETQTNTTFCQWISRLTSDLIRASPNLKMLHCTANIYLVQHMSKMKFGSQLEKLILYFHTDKPWEGVYALRKILSQLPKLKELAVEESFCESSCECFSTGEDACICDDIIETIYGAMKSYVDNTEIYMRYYSFEDSEMVMYL